MHNVRGHLHFRTLGTLHKRLLLSRFDGAKLNEHKGLNINSTEMLTDASLLNEHINQTRKIDTFKGRGSRMVKGSYSYCTTSPPPYD